MRFKIAKNAMGAHEPLSLPFIAMSSVVSFFINLLLIYPWKNNIHFINTHSSSSQWNQVSYLGVKPVSRFVMVSPIIVKVATLISMFNVVWSQTSLSTKVISTNLSSLGQHINKIALVVILKVTKYFVVLFVNLISTSIVLCYHIPQGTNNISIPSLFIMLLKMTLMNIIVISMKKNEIQILGLDMLTQLIFTHNPLLSLRKLKMVVVILAVSFSCNVPSVISPSTINVYRKEKCVFNFHIYIFLLGCYCWI